MLVVILGGGLSGLVAAEHLIQLELSYRTKSSGERQRKSSLGAESPEDRLGTSSRRDEHGDVAFDELHVLVLEARDRFGGRTSSIRLPSDNGVSGPKNGDDGDDDAAVSPLVDLGATWMWPHSNPSLAELCKRLGVESFPDRPHGDCDLYEDEAGTLHRVPLRRGPQQRRFFRGSQDISMELVRRLYAMTSSTATTSKLSSFSSTMGANDSCTVGCETVTLKLNCAVTKLTYQIEDKTVTVSFIGNGDVARAAAKIGLNTTLTDAAGAPGPAALPALTSISANLVISTIPQQVAAMTIGFSPALPDRVIRTMRSTKTWMAAQGKAVVQYSHPFWRAYDDGDGRRYSLSGQVFSRMGPLDSIYDVSVPSINKVAKCDRGAGGDGTGDDVIAGDTASCSGKGVLFGFLGAYPRFREASEDEQRQQVLGQLYRLFGPQALNPDSVVIHDWMRERFTATELDAAYVNPWEHPDYSGGAQVLQSPLWDGALWLGGSEVCGDGGGGFLEGAVVAGQEAAQRAFSVIQRRR